MSWLRGTWEGGGSRPSWRDSEGNLAAGPGWRPAERRGPERPLRLASIEVEGSAWSGVGAHCGPHLEGKVRGISGNLMGTSECSCSDWLAV